jgi:hypothetical protein
MAVFELSYVTGHLYSWHRTRARGWRSGPGGWAVVPRCSCGWNHTHSKKFGFQHSPSGSIFSDHYADQETAEKVWQEEHIDRRPPDYGQTLLVRSGHDVPSKGDRARRKRAGRR